MAKNRGQSTNCHVANLTVLTFVRHHKNKPKHHKDRVFERFPLAAPTWIIKLGGFLAGSNRNISWGECKLDNLQTLPYVAGQLKLPMFRLSNATTTTTPTQKTKTKSNSNNNYLIRICKATPGLQIKHSGQSQHEKKKKKHHNKTPKAEVIQNFKHKEP